jgi:hypothetical protein
MTVAKPMPEWTQDDMARLIQRTEIDGNGCWVIHAKEGDYGLFKKDGLTYPAHRASYSMFKGPVPVDRVVDHQCGNKACVNPQHLLVTTTKQNTRNVYKECSAGHPYSYPNIFESNGKRKCVACYLQQLERKQQRKSLTVGGTCRNGHLLTWENVYEYPETGAVICRQCSLSASKSRYYAKPLPNLSAHDQRKMFKLIKLSADGCWEWQGHKKAGYGRWVFDGASYPVHRLMYQLEYGKIDREYVVDHLCNNKSCCNPAHLEAVTDAVNKERSRKSKQYKKPFTYKRPKKTNPRFEAPPDYLTVQELAERENVTAAQIHRWIEKRGLPSRKMDNKRYVRIDQYQLWLQTRQVRQNKASGQLSLLP